MAFQSCQAVECKGVGMFCDMDACSDFEDYEFTKTVCGDVFEKRDEAVASLNEKLSTDVCSHHPLFGDGFIFRSTSQKLIGQRIDKTDVQPKKSIWSRIVNYLS